MSETNEIPPPPPPPPPAAPPPPPPSPPAASVTHDERQMAFVVYILYLVHFVPVIGWVATIVGLVLAYVERPTAPEWLKSHYTFQIRTFWIGLVFLLVSCFLCLILVGFALLVLTWIWFIVRCAVGLSRLLRNEAYPTPESWVV